MTKTSLFLLAFMLYISSAYTQSENELEINVENLSKTWEVFDVISETKSTADLEEVKDMVEGVSLKLNKDMTFSFSFVLDLDGTWKLEDNVIHTKDRKGNNSWTIHSLKKEVIILSRNEAKQKLVFKSM